MTEGMTEKSTKKSIFRTCIFLSSLVFLMGCHNSLMLGGTAEHREAVVKANAQGLVVSALVHVSVNQNGPDMSVTPPYKSRRGAIPAVCELESLYAITI